jgi:hypothetical protein
MIKIEKFQFNIQAIEAAGYKITKTWKVNQKEIQTIFI